MNIAQIERRGLEPMHTDHSRTAVGEDTPQGQFSELFRNMLGSGPSALTSVNFVPPELKVELPEEVAEQAAVAEEEVVQDEAAEEEATEEAVVAKEAEVVEEVVSEEVAVKTTEVIQEKVQTIERTDRSVEDNAPIVAIDKNFQVDTAREVSTTQAAVTPEMQGQMADGEQASSKGQNRVEKIIADVRSSQDDSQAKNMASDAARDMSLMFTEDTGASATAASNVASQAKPVAPTSEALYGAATQLQTHIDAAVNTGGKSSLGSQVSATAGLSNAKDDIAHSKKAAHTELPKKASSNEMVDKIRDLIMQANQSKDPNTISVRISPEGLGAMVVKISQKGDQTHARIIPESSETESMLRGKVQEIAQALQTAGMRIDNIHVSIGHEITEADFFNFAQFNGFGNEASDDDLSNLAQGERDLNQENGEALSSEQAQRVQAKELRQQMLDQGWVA